MKKRTLRATDGWGPVLDWNEPAPSFIVLFLYPEYKNNM